MSNSLVNLPAPSPIKRKLCSTADNSDSRQGENQHIQKRVSGYRSTKQSYLNGTVMSFQNNLYRIKYDDGDEEDVPFRDPNASDGRDLVRMLDNYARHVSVRDCATSSENDDGQIDHSDQMHVVDSVLDSSDKTLDTANLSKLSSWTHSSLPTMLLSGTTSLNDSIDTIIQLCHLLEETVKAGIRLDLIRESRREFDNGNTKVRSLIK
jgi:hypothetical protein